jgi:hypothetical protein
MDSTRWPWFALLLAGVAACGGGEASVSSGEPGTGGGADEPSSGGGPSSPGSGGGGTPAPSGGTTVSGLVFAVVGDTRPARPNDIAGYPKDIITKIYAGIAASSAKPSFVVGTGDYQFSDAYGNQATEQLDIYLAARRQYSGPFYPVMGNHECTGATASNCGQGSANGVTNNYSAFLSKLLTPIEQTLPYYGLSFKAADGSWTAKFLFLAANAWSSAQGAWLEQAMTPQTTYTFVVRHEPGYDTQAPGVAPSEAIMAKHPYTLALVGHTHTFRKSYTKNEVIIGNGGAPITSGANYGWALFQRRSDGAIQCDMIDYESGQATPSLGFVVKADGTAG